MKPIDISPKDLATVRSILEKHVPEYEVRAFGSRVSWTAKGSSDLDLAIMTDKPLATVRLADLKEELSESDLPFKVDVGDWAAIKEGFRKIIETQAVRIYKPAGEPMVKMEFRKLHEVTDNFDSQRIPVKERDRKRGIFPYYGASGIIDYVDNYIFDGEYLLVAEDGENLKTRNTPIAFIAKGKYWVNNHAHIIRGNQLADTRYLLYALNNTEISGYLTGSTMPKLTQDNLKRIQIPYFPLSTQRAIASILGSLDDKIELNRQMNETLEATARAIYKSWFVDFDPVKAKAEGRRPFGMDDETAKLFPSGFEESKLGRIPKGWKAGDISDVSEINARTLSANDSLSETHYIEIRLADGGAYPAVRPDIISNIKRCIPHKEIIDKYETIAKPLFELAWKNREEAKTLANIRAQLLPRLLSGELSIS